MNRDARWLDVCAFGWTWSAFSIDRFTPLFLWHLLLFLGMSHKVACTCGSVTSITMSHTPHAGIPSRRKPASKDMTSASVPLEDTAVCFFCRDHPTGTNVSLHTLNSSWRWFLSLRSYQQKQSDWFLGIMKHFYTQIPKIQSWDTIHPWTRIKRNNLSFCRTVWNWGLFLAHPTCWHERATSEHALKKKPPDVDFWIFPSHLRNQNLELIPILHCCAVFSHVAMLSVSTRVMNERYQTCQTFVTSSRPPRDGASKLVYIPENIRSTNTSQV